MLFTCTDFGHDGPYLGLMEAVARRHAPTLPIVHLFSDLPAFFVRESAYLIAAYTQGLPAESVVLGVVDPGVGMQRRPIVLRADSVWFVGPDNGLFALVARRAAVAQWWEIAYPVDAPVSQSFHGRDVFAPVAAALAKGEEVPGHAIASSSEGGCWPDDHAAIVYVDRYGNGMTGLRGLCLTRGMRLAVSGHEIPQARVFGEVPTGAPLCYVNSNGLVEIAVNQGRASDRLGLAVGTPVGLLADVS